jgi:hypothetical protein
MPNATGPVISVQNEPCPAHRFNPAVVGRGYTYPRLDSGDSRCIIDIWAGPPGPKPPLRRGFPPAIRVRHCHVSTDTKPTIFQGNIADYLNLRVMQPFTAAVDTFDQPCVGLWCKHNLWVAIGPTFRQLGVWFPVEPLGHGWEWRFDFPKWNVLGTDGVLDHCMLCVTAERMFAFDLL